MARSHVRWRFGAWRDPEHAETSKDARLMYVTVLADEAMNQAGIVVMRPGVWAEDAAMTDDEAMNALDELEKRRFLVIDRRRCELLVRSFIRNDGVADQPNVLRSALSVCLQQKSLVIRRALALELRRLPAKQPDKQLSNGRLFVHPDPHAVADEIDPGPLGVEDWKGSENPSADPPPKGPVEPPRNPSANPSESDIQKPFAEGFGEPPGVGEGVGESVPSPEPEAESTSSRGGSGGSASRKRSADAQGHRLPDDWWPADADRAWLRETYPQLLDRAKELTEEFRDFWWSKAGKDARKTDWSKTWRNRMRDRAGVTAKGGPTARLAAPSPGSRPSASRAAAEQAQSLRRRPRLGPESSPGSSPTPPPAQPTALARPDLQLPLMRSIS